MPTTSEPSPARTIRFHSLGFLLFVVIGAVLSTWPAMLFDGPLFYFDTGEYLSRGEKIVHRVVGTVLRALDSGGGDPIAAAEAAGGAGGGGGSFSPKVMRSAPYAVFAYVASLGGSMLFGIVLAQSALVYAAAWPLVAGRDLGARWACLLAVAICLGASSLPWYASYLMPDILGAVVILYAATLVLCFDRLDWFGKLLTGGLAAFAILSHYGNIPLAAVCFTLALVLRWLRGGLTLSVGIAALAPFIAALAINVGGSSASMDGPSAAPARLPVLLARSIEDGPARWHLQEACAEYDYAVCEIWGDEVPDTVGTVLWHGNGLSKASKAQLRRIRDEEPVILWRAFISYPGAQLWSLFGNSVRQMFLVGLDQFYVSDPRGASQSEHDLGRGTFDAFGVVLTATYLASLAALVGLIAARPTVRDDWAAFTVIVLVGLVANAAIFGGLSYPVDRYQGRIAWLVTLVACLAVLERRAQRARHGSGWAHDGRPAAAQTRE